MKRINSSITNNVKQSLILLMVLLMSNVSAFGVSVYSYTMPGSAVGGTISFSKTPGNNDSSYKIDGDSKYVCITLQSGITLEEGDVITITGHADSNGQSFKLKNSTSSGTSVNTNTITTKSVTQQLTYTVTSSDCLVGRSTFYIYRTSGSIYFHGITIDKDASKLVSLVHTASTYSSNDRTIHTSCDAEFEHYNNVGNRTNGNIGQAVMKFSFIVPAGKVIESATLKWSTKIGGNNTTERNNDLRCLKTGLDPDWNALANGTATSMLWSYQSDDAYIANPLLGKNTHYNVVNDVTSYIRNREGQGYVVFMLSNNAAGADLFGKGSANYKPVLTLTYTDKSDVCAITYNANTYGTCDRTYDVCDKTSPTAVTLPNITAVSNRYFTGWYTAASGGTFVGNAGDSYTPSTSITLYAHYVESVSTSALVGSTDRRVELGKSFSQPTRINEGETYNFTFNNYGNDNRNGISATAYDNWVMTVGNSNSTIQPFLLSASSYWWNNNTNGYLTFTPTGTGNMSTYQTALQNGAPVNVKVNYDGTYINIVATTVYNGISYTVSGKSVEMPASIKADGYAYIWFTTWNSYIDNFTSRKESADATVSSLSVNNLTLTPSETTYSYSIGNAYTSNTIDVTVTPNDAGAVVSTSAVTGAAGQPTVITATIGTPLTFTVIAGDNSTTATYTVNITRAEDIAATNNAYAVTQRNYHDGQRIVGDNITAWISTTATGNEQPYLVTNTASTTGASGTEYTRYMLCGYGKNPAYDGRTGLPSSGTYYAFRPTKNGKLEVAVNLSAGRTFFISDGNNIMAYGNDEGQYTTSPALNANNQLDANAPMYATIPVEAGKTYYVYAAGTKMGLMGFCLYDDLVSSITISGTTTVGINSTTRLTATVTPANATNKEVTWSSADNSIATVSADGVVTGKADGEVEITATANDGSGVSASYTVTVVTKTYSYTINAVDDNGKLLKELVSDAYVEGSGAIKVAYPKYVLVGHTLYEIPKNNNGDDYRRSITPDTDGYTLNLTYSAAVENVVFYTEAEHVEGLTNRLFNDNSAISSHASNAGIAGRQGNANYIDVTTLKAGNYTIYASAINGNGADFTYRFKAGNTEVMSASVTNGINRQATSSMFTVSDDTQLTLSCSTGNAGGLDYFYIVQEPVYHVTTDGQQFNFTKENVDANTFITANTLNASSDVDITRNNVTGIFYNIKNSSNYITITEEGAIAFSLDAYHNNSKDTRIIRVYIDGVEKTSFNIAPGEYATSAIYATGSTGQHTIRITGNGKDIYPVDIVFYTEHVVPQLNFTTASVKVGETKDFVLTVPSGCTLDAMTDSGDANKIVASFVKDNSNERKGTLTLTGLQTTGNTPTSVTFSISGSDETIYKDGTATISIDVLKAALSLIYSDGDSGDEAAAYLCNADETTPALPTITLKAIDGNGNNVLLNNLSMTYTSDDPTVATIDNAGVITLTTPYGNGTAVIRAKATSANYDDAEAEYSITIQRGVNWKMTTHPTFKDTAPAVRDTFHVYKNIDGVEKLYLVGTFGGWNRNNNKYNYPQANGGTKEQTDSWSKLNTSSSGVDGFTKYRNGSNDACNENMYSSLDNYYYDVIYGVKRFGWFKQPDGNTTHPFTLPVRGAYITLEPEVNGTLSIYIQQNGPWNTNKDDVYDNDGNLVSKNSEDAATPFPGSVPFQFRPHAFFIVDQNGHLVDTYAPISMVSRTKINTGLSETDDEILNAFCANYSCEKGEKFKCITDETADGYNDVTNIANWKEFKEYMSPGEQQRIEANWSAGINDAQVITKLDNGAYLALENGMVKYTFHVIAGQTYYVFSNFSKIGFSGCNFVPDEENQPSDTLELSEKVAYDPSSLKPGDAINTKPMYETITLDRKFTNKKWNTICLPFTMTEREVEDVFGKNTELIILDRVNVDAGHASIFMTYHEIQSILAGYPYLIKPTQDVDHIEVHNKVIDPDQQALEFSNNGYTSKGISGFCTANVSNNQGTVNTYSYRLKAGDIFLNSNTLYISAGNSYLYGYRSYLELEAGATGAKSVSMSYSNAWFDDEEDSEATSIAATEFAPEALEALGITTATNGVYNLNGQRVAEKLTGLPKGIYIVNGQKMIVE